MTQIKDIFFVKKIIKNEEVKMIEKYDKLIQIKDYKRAWLLRVKMNIVGLKNLINSFYSKRLYTMKAIFTFDMDKIIDIFKDKRVS